MQKSLIYGLAIMALVLSLGLLVNTTSVSAAYAPTTGDLIKTSTDSAVYYIDTDLKRHLFVNSVTFWTWYTGSWSSIKFDGTTKTLITITQSDFDSLDSGNNMTARPGVRLIKFQNSSKTYAVSANSQLALIPNASTAISMFGSNWNSKVITIQNGFESDYTEGQPLTAVSINSGGGWVSSSTGLLLDCGSNAHADQGGLGCSFNNRPCGIYGTGLQSWINSSWGECQYSSCISGYTLSNNNCVLEKTCDINMHVENNTCVSDTKPCTVSHGIGNYKWMAVTKTWSTGCWVTSCDSGYQQSSNISCVINNCPSGYIPDGSNCILPQDKYCGIAMHNVNGVCVPN